MIVNNCSHIRMNTIKNKTYKGDVASNNASCCIVEDTLYGIKAQNDGIVVLYKIPSFSKSNSPITYYPIKYNDGTLFRCHHANSITICGGGFIIATMDKPAAIKITKTGRIVREIKRFNVEGEERSMSSISYYKTIDNKAYYIVNHSTVQNDDETFTPRYRLAILDGDLYDTQILYTTNIKLNNDWVANDTYYDTKTHKFYNTYFGRNSKGQIAVNYVHQFSITKIDSSQVLQAEKKWIVESQGDETKFEIETFFISNNKKYCIVNTEGDGTDGLFKLINK